MASILLVAGTPGHRFATKRSRILLHQPLGGFGGGHVQASDMEIEVKEILYYKKQLFDFLAEKTGKSYEEIEKDADRDCWLSAEEALNYGPKGIIDEIISGKK
jgi:ATP-dependent Clp protease protease subunit